MSSLGPLVAADEQLIHQVTDTFGSVGQSDRSWTEKIWVSVFAPDGSLQADFGLGLYPNRGVVDGFAGVSRGVEQWTVRASRELGSDPATTVGPLHYEVLDPLRSVRIALDQQDVVPVRFDCTVTGVVPACLEERELKRSPDTRRIDSDIVRFHQTGRATGWIEVDGDRTQVDSSWVAARDRSWGVRYMIGEPARDLPRARRDRDGGSLSIWSPVLCTRADGSEYAIHLYFHSEISATRSHTEFQGGAEHPDGRRDHFMALRPELRFDPANRRLRGGTVHATSTDGSDRPLTVTVMAETGFHLGAGRYFSFEGKWHGQWEGPLNVEGEHLADCADPEMARRLHQIRDCIVRVEDPVGGGVGVGTMQTMAFGVPPGTDLTAEGTFL